MYVRLVKLPIRRRRKSEGGQKSKSLILVRLFDEIRTYFERNWRRALRAKPNARAGKKEGGWGEGIFARPRFSAAAEFRANEAGAPPFKSDSALLNSFS